VDIAFGVKIMLKYILVLQIFRFGPNTASSLNYQLVGFCEESDEPSRSKKGEENCELRNTRIYLASHRKYPIQ
jgi:hypothetical protein